MDGAKYLTPSVKSTGMFGLDSSVTMRVYATTHADDEPASAALAAEGVSELPDANSAQSQR